MAYLIDSDVVIDHLGGNPSTHHLLERLSLEGVAISAVTYMEVYQGTLISPDPQQALVKFDAFLVAVPVVSFSDAIARRCAHLRVDLQRQHKRVRQRALDLLIAATALEHGLTLVTRNHADYDDIPNLTLYQPA